MLQMSLLTFFSSQVLTYSFSVSRHLDQIHWLARCAPATSSCTLQPCLMIVNSYGAWAYIQINRQTVAGVGIVAKMHINYCSNFSGKPCRAPCDRPTAPGGG